MSSPVDIVLVGPQTLCVDAAAHALSMGPATTLVGRLSSVDSLATYPFEADSAPAVVLSAHYRDVRELIADVERCRQLRPSCAVVVFGCMATDYSISARLAAAGASVLPNPLRMSALSGMVAAAVKEPKAIAMRAARQLLGHGRARTCTACMAEVLSERETQIVGLLAEGATNQAIAARLHISERTVKNHLYRVYQKLEVSSRGQAVAEAVRRGLVVR